MKNNIKRKYRIPFVIGLVILGVIIYFLTGLFHGYTKRPQICLSSGMCFDIEVVDTPASRQQGLMYREFLPEWSGMLFIFEESDLHMFWMKNTLIPLDMLWIDENFNVVNILTAQPCTVNPCSTYNPWTSAKYVLEINAWMAAKYGIIKWTTMRLINIQ